jgi:regulator of sigma D
MPKDRVSSDRFVAGLTGAVLAVALALLGSGTAIAQGKPLLVSGHANAEVAPTTNASLSVDYTGALYGYYRIERNLPDFGDLGPPKAFSHKNSLLLGMGDNFGPEFGASVQGELRNVADCILPANKPRWGQKNAPPEILYKNDDRLPKLAECDNVGRFLMQAGYSAIVPGKEDFLYSARWLRRMALLFRGASGPPTPDFPEDKSRKGAFITDCMEVCNSDHKLLMLAANLRVNFKAEGLEPVDIRIGKQTFAKNVKGTCPLFLTWEDPLASAPDSCLSGGENGNTVTKEMDWLRRLDLIVDQERNCIPDPRTYDDCIPVAISMNLRASKDPEFRKQLLENEGKIALSALGLEPDLSLFGQVCPKDAKTRILKLYEVAKKDAASLEKLEKTKPDADISKAFMESKGVADDLFAFVEQSRALDSRYEAYLAFVRDLKTVFDDLDARFLLWNEPWSRPTLGRSYLLSPDARKAGVRLLLRKIAAEQKDVGYTIAGRPNSGLRTLVIGVVGQETMKAVSPINLQLCTLGMRLSQTASAENFGPCTPPKETRLDKKVQLDQENDIAPEANGRLVGTIKVGDPVLAVTTLLRAAWLTKSAKPFDFDNVVVMAQMPRTEAEELAARVLESLKKTANCAELPIAQDPDPQISCADSKDTPKLPHVDLIISEAQPGHTTGTVTLNYSLDSVIPVVSPQSAWYIKHDESGLIQPVSIVTINPPSPDHDRILMNEVAFDNSKPKPDSKAPQHSGLKTMAQLLYEELDKPKQKQPRDLSNLKKIWTTRCEDQKACQDSAMMQFLLTQIQRDSHADAVLVEYRDFYFGRMLDERYGSYQICDTWLDDQKKFLDDQQKLLDGQIANEMDKQKKKSLEDQKKKLSADQKRLTDKWDDLRASCQLRVALDRVLWKGDYSERVMVDGKTLKDLLMRAQQETDDEQTLAARDTTREWLLTFGIVTKSPDNLSAASMGPETFSIPGISFCKEGADPQGPEYCINGQKISDDGAYGIATSDHLAKDTQVYKLLNALDSRYHWRKTGEFLTAEIANEIDIGRTGSAPDTPNMMSKVEEYQQVRPILQLDYAKVVAGFMFRKPNLSNAQLASNFSGVADSRATTPSAQELDLEAVTRMTRGLGAGDLLRRFKVGIQSDLEYDRAVTGNLSGSPDTVTYALNSFTTGGFLQMRLFGKLLPRLLLVAAPYQFQQQITGNYLNFKFATGTGQITVATPRWEGFSQRLGARYEFGGGKWPDIGSYVEAGPEYSVLNNVLSGLLLPNGFVCQASAVAFATCVKNHTTVTAGTKLKPLTETLHTGGAYWDVHLQKALDKAKRFSVTVETKGDNFMLPGVTLPTQSRYAFTTSGALNFAVIGNLVFSPTYTTFFYKNQGTPDESHSLVTNTFSVTAKWYFARDAAVPFWRQLWFRGPASADQTKSARMK